MGDAARLSRVNDTLRWFDQLREWGFTPAQAQAVWREHRVIASPVLWSHRALRQDARLRAAAWAQRTLRARLLTIDHPRAWEHYWKAMPDFLRYLERRISQRGRKVSGALRGLWPTIAMGEDTDSFDGRCKEPLTYRWAGGPALAWDDVIEVALRHMVLDRLVEQTPMVMASEDEEPAWQRTLTETGLRSIRWGWLDSVAEGTPPGRVRAGLLMAQNLLGAGLGWRGQILGLGGHTSLVLVDRGRSDGIVQPDPTGEGQTLTIDTWTILAHEWAHVLDRRVGHLAGGPKPWATTSLLAWQEEADPGPLLLAWFETMARVMLETPDETVLVANRLELPQWALRATMALGGLGEVREEIIRQQHMLDHDTWTIESAERGWLRLLDNRPLAVIPPQVRRTAQLLARDTAYAQASGRGQANGGWMDYLGRLPESDIDGNPCKPGDPGCPRYLTHPIEVMARSFEAAIGCDRPLDSVWTPQSLRPNAGLMWPLLAETRSQREAWLSTLSQVRTLAGPGLGIMRPRVKE